MIRLLRRLLAIVAFVGVGAWLLTGAIDNELASGGVLTERSGGIANRQDNEPPKSRYDSAQGRSNVLIKSRDGLSVSTCGASSIGPDGIVTVTSCGERLSERASDVRRPGRRDEPAAPRSESLYQGKQASIRAIRKVFGRRAPAAIRIASCETGGTFYARAVGRAGERGLFQIHPIHFSWAQPARLFDPVWNSRVAFRLSRGGTRWGPWTCRWAA